MSNDRSQFTNESNDSEIETGTFVHCWHTLEVREWKLLIKIDGWRIQEVFTLADPMSKITFTAVSGFDQNNSFHEHNLWEGKTPLHEPISPAAEIFTLQEDPKSLLMRFSKSPFTFHRAAYEDSQGCFFQAQELTEGVIVRISIPPSAIRAFRNRLCKCIPSLTKIIQSKNSMKIWYVLMNGETVATYHLEEPAPEQEPSRLHKILQSTESALTFFTNR